MNYDVSVTWMPPPGSIQGCPPGLEYLSHLDQVVIKQEASLIEGKEAVQSA